MQKYINKKKAILLLTVLALYVVIITPLLIISLQKKQELRGKAATTILTSGPSCPNAYTDSLMIMDESSSMNEPIDGEGETKIEAAKNAARSFVDLLATDTRNNTSLVSFESTAAVEGQLTNNFDSIRTLINDLGTEDGDTCHECAIIKANEEVTARGRTNTKKVGILLTDGLANRVYNDPNLYNDNPAFAEGRALDAVATASAQNNIIFYTIGLGSNVNTDFLEQIADMTGGRYYFSPTTDELEEIYQEISEIISAGSISGFVFNDINGNGDFNTGEPMLSDWDVQLASSGGTQTYTTESNGTYSFNDLCDGDYNVSEIIQSGWQQTLPASSSGYPITIDNGSSFTDKNFGNMITQVTPPTAIPNPATLLNITAYLHGIGNSGDNTNPNDTDLSNKNPVHKTIDAGLEIFNTNNDMVAQGNGKISYATTSGNFKGTLQINPGTITSGKYYIKVTTNYHLKRLVPGILTIIAGQENTVPAATLITGDSDNNNKLNILDYNSLLDCYDNLTPATACNPDKKIATDFNDDSFVNQFDYNLFLRELATQPGE